ncbi:MAG: lysylphosphatidylglycerol synthase transmembrane domain-containing protein [Bacteroidota bacterium]
MTDTWRRWSLSRRARWLAALILPAGVALNVGLALSSNPVELAAIRFQGLAAAVGLAMAPWVFSAARVVLWTRFVGQGLAFRSALRATLSGIVGSAITPTGSGAVAIKWGLAVRHGVSPGAAGSLLAVETLEEAAVVAVGLPLVLVLASAEWATVQDSVVEAGAGAAGQIVWGIFIGVAAITGLALSFIGASRGLLGSRAQHIAERLRQRLRFGLQTAWQDARQVWADIPRRGIRWVGAGLLLAACQLTARLSVAWIVLRSLGIDIPASTSWALQWLTLSLAGIVPTPGGTGGAEAAFAMLYAAWIPLSSLALATALWRASLYYLPVLIASVVLLAPWGKAPSQAPESE